VSRRFVKGRIALALIPLGLAACTSPTLRESTPLIETINQHPAPPESKLVIENPAPAMPQPELALENYRKLVELDADPKIKAEALRRIADLQVQIADDHGNTDPESKRNLADSIKIYQSLLAQRPNDPANDVVLYQLARAYRNNDQPHEAIAALSKLEQIHPGSEIILDSRFMSGQLLYSAKRYPEAEKEYAAIVQKGPSAGPLFEPAQYKYAWSLFDQDEYEEAIGVFIQILDRLLPQNPPLDAEAALAQVQKEKVDFARDSMRGLNLGFSELGGAKALEDYFSQHPEPRFSPVIYTALGDSFLEKRRYTDAARTYALFVTHHPQAAEAPAFQSKVIAAYQAGGFSEPVLVEKERYAKAYDPEAPYWNGRTPTPEVMNDLHKHLEDLAKYHHELAQKDPKEKRGEYLVAAGWYRKIVKDFPNDPQTSGINLLLADALLDGGQTRAAADEYLRTAYVYPANAKSRDAAYAAVQTYQRYEGEVPADQKAAAQRLTADAGVKLADTFPDHPQKLPVLTRAAENLYAIGDRQQAITVATRVVEAKPAATPQQQRSAWAVIADSQYSLEHYHESEIAYGKLQELMPKTDPAYKATTERYSASIYKQADAARTSGNLAVAAQAYQRAGENATSENVRASADYDAAATYIQMKDWAHAEPLLETFPRKHPDSKLLPDVDKKLAVVYQNDNNKKVQAAALYSRIAARPSETAEVRRESAWLSAQLYDQANLHPQALQAYQSYLTQYPQPFDHAMDARQRIADFYHEQNDTEHYDYWLHNIVAADASAGAARSDKSRAMAAKATLQFGREQARTADAIPLKQPLKKSIALKNKSMQTAIDTLTQAANAGFADVTTAATYELATLYQHFGRSLTQSERPRNLKGDALEQYVLLLDEQAEPFVEKAIQTHETNLQRIKSNVYDEWVARSLTALGELAPAKYGKIELKDMNYDRPR
jgi:TolA-binding protein